MQVGYAKIDDVRQITRCNSKTLTVASAVNLVRSQVYHTERPPLFAVSLPNCRDTARRAGSSATADTSTVITHPYFIPIHTTAIMCIGSTLIVLSQLLAGAILY